MRQRRKKHETKPLPFKVNRELAANLTDQVADGFRRAITSGYYKSGDYLPPVTAIVKELGVSLRVAYEGVRKLVESGGYAVARRRIGCRVLSRTGKRWQGRILAAIRSSHVSSYYFASLIDEMRRLLVKEGWLFTVVTIGEKGRERVDLSMLREELNVSTDFAFTIFDQGEVARAFVKSGVPFLLIDSEDVASPFCRGHVHTDFSVANAQILRRCRMAGIKKAAVISYVKNMAIVEAFRNAGIDVECLYYRQHRGFGFLERIEKDAMRLALDRFGRSLDMPDLVYVYDDFTLRGVLAAFAALGVRVPEHVKVIGFANRGAIPATIQAIAHLEADPLTDAAMLTTAIRSVINGKELPPKSVLAPFFVDGSTFPV